MSIRADGRHAKSKRLGDRRIWGYGATEAEALEDLQRKLVEIESQNVTRWTRDSLLHDVAHGIWEPLVKAKSPETAARYFVAYVHVRDGLGMRRIGTITTQDIQRLIDSLLTKPVSRSGKGAIKKPMDPTTVRFCLMILKQILSLAVEDGIIELNPYRPRRLTVPKQKEKRERYLTSEEATKLIKECPSHLRCAVYLATYLGLRRGEICGLEWGDIDILKQTVSIKRQRGNRGEKKSLKTASSKRTLHVPRSMIDLIFRFGDQDNRKVCPISPRDLTDGWIAWEAKPAGWTFHDLRHGAAGLLVAATGGDMLAVKAILGHTNLDTTMVYTADRAAQTEAAFAALEPLTTALWLSESPL